MLFQAGVYCESVYHFSFNYFLMQARRSDGLEVLQIVLDIAIEAYCAEAFALNTQNLEDSGERLQVRSYQSKAI